MPTVRSLNFSVTADSKPLAREMKRARFQVRRESQALGREFRQIGTRAALGLAAATTAFAGLARESINFADQTAKAARNAQLSVSSYQRLAFVFRQAGSSNEVLVKAIQTQLRAVFEAERGMLTYIDAFDKLGVSYTALARQTPEEQFATIVGALSELRSETDQAALAQIIFGRGGREMGTLLTFTTEQIRALGARLDDLGGTFDSNTDRAEHLNDQLDLLRSVVQVRFAQAILDAVGANRTWDDTIRTVGQTVQDRTTDMIGFANAVYNMRDGIVAAGTALVTYFAAAKLVSIATGIAAVTKAMGTLATGVAAGAVTVSAGAGLIAVLAGLVAALALLEQFRPSVPDEGAPRAGRFAPGGLGGATGIAPGGRFAPDAVAGGVDNIRNQQIREQELLRSRDLTDVLQEIVVTARRRGTARPADGLEPIRLREGLGDGVGAVNPRVQAVRDLLDSADEALAEAVQSEETKERLRDRFVSFRDSMIGTLSQALATGNVDGVAEAFRVSLVTAISENLLRQGLNIVGGLLGIEGLPSFHGGGVVPGRRGADVPVIAQAGEVIFTPEQLRGLGNTTITYAPQITGNVDAATLEAMNRHMGRFVDATQQVLQQRRLLPT